MKRNIIIFCTAFLIILTSCNKESYINFGFDSPIYKDSKGLIIAHISQTDQTIFLSGSVRLSEGEMEIILMNSNGIAIYLKTLIGPVELHINETFEAIPGYWKLKYTSRDGIGEIDLHIHNY